MYSSCSTYVRAKVLDDASGADVSMSAKSEATCLVVASSEGLS
jgi:hypothetical protein